MELLILFFLITVFFIFYTYIGYPISLLLLSYLKEKRVNKSEYYPNVSLIITVFNEENNINRKLKNLTELNYPKEKLEIIIASDGSTDRTNQIVSDYKHGNLKLLEIKERMGKENAQKQAIQKANGEILIFNDVGTMLAPEGLNVIVSNFADDNVGCVSSVDKLLTKDGKPSGEGFYVRYEMWLRKLESRVNTIIGLSGSFFAARKEVFYDFSENMQSDFRTLLNSVKIGMRGVSDPEAVGYYFDLKDNRREFNRKVRTIIRGITVFFNHHEFLNVFKYRLFSYQYFCHKLLRWSVPLFLILAFVLNVVLAVQSKLFIIILAGHCLFYLMAVIGFFMPRMTDIIFIKIPFFFTSVNLAIAIAWIKYLRGERVVMWEPSKR